MKFEFECCKEKKSSRYARQKEEWHLAEVLANVHMGSNSSRGKTAIYGCCKV